MMKPLDLPPLGALRIFEAAGRHLSFKCAADELNVTPSAVSHGIQSLERTLGVALFDREPSGISLSDDGARFHPRISRAFATLARATDEVPGRLAQGTLTVSVAPTFATHWLLPRLQRFAERCPNVNLRIDTERLQRDLPVEGIDLAIRMAPSPRSDGTWLRIVSETLVPVCSPSLLEAAQDLSSADMLRTLPLIHVSTARADWDHYLREVSIEDPLGELAFSFDTLSLAMLAAKQGVGIALARLPLCRDLVDARELVEIGAAACDARTSYWLVGLEVTFDRSDAKAFRQWILDEMASDQRTLQPSDRHGS